MIMPLLVGGARFIKLVEDVLQGDHLVGLLTSKDPEQDNPTLGQIYEVGTAAKIHRVMRFSYEKRNIQIIVEGLEHLCEDC